MKAALASDGPPRYVRAAQPGLADGFEPRIRELLKLYPQMPATVIADRIGWPHSIRTLSGRVAELRPLYLPPDPASRTSYDAGELAQCDFWFPDITLPVGFGQSRTAKRLPVLTMACGYSRHLAAALIPSRHAGDLFAGWWQLIENLGAVPRVLVWDGEGAIGRWRAGKAELTGDCQAFRGTLGAKVIVCKPADPEAKGLVERFHDYLERSFLPGREFSGPADFNAQLARWLAVAADILLRRPAHGRIYRVQFTELQVTLDREQPWELDGEVMGSTRKLTVAAQPGALLLRMPPESA